MSTTHDIVIALEDELRLQSIVRSAVAAGDGHRAAFLGNKLHRAAFVPAARLESDRVRLLGSGWYRDEVTGAVRDFTLVHPGHQRKAIGLISVLSETGAALLGRRAGQRVSWHRTGGGHRTVDILGVSPTAAHPATGGEREYARGPLPEPRRPEPRRARRM